MVDQLSRLSEPDISQLMEDLETISREKETLLADKRFVEDVCMKVNEAAEREIVRK